MTFLQSNFHSVEFPARDLRRKASKKAEGPSIGVVRGNSKFNISYIQLFDLVLHALDNVMSPPVDAPIAAALRPYVHLVEASARSLLLLGVRSDIVNELRSLLSIEKALSFPRRKLGLGCPSPHRAKLNTAGAGAAAVRIRTAS